MPKQAPNPTEGRVLGEIQVDGKTIELKLLDRKFEKKVVKALVEAYTKSNSDVVSVLYGPRSDYKYASEFAETCKILIKNDLKAVCCEFSFYLSLFNAAISLVFCLSSRFSHTAVSLLFDRELTSQGSCAQARRSRPVLSGMAVDKASKKVLSVLVGNDWNDPLLEDDEEELREEIEEDVFETLYEDALRQNKSIRWLDRAPLGKAFLMFLGGTVPSAQGKGIFSALGGALTKYANEVVGYEYAVAIANNAATTHILEDKGKFDKAAELEWAEMISDIVKDGCKDDDEDDSYKTLAQLAQEQGSDVVEKNPTAGFFVAQIAHVKSRL